MSLFPDYSQTEELNVDWGRSSESTATVLFIQDPRLVHRGLNTVQPGGIPTECVAGWWGTCPCCHELMLVSLHAPSAPSVCSCSTPEGCTRTSHQQTSPFSRPGKANLFISLKHLLTGGFTDILLIYGPFKLIKDGFILMLIDKAFWFWNTLWHAIKSSNVMSSLLIINVHINQQVDNYNITAG